MAEPVSAIVALTSFALVTLREVVTFIQDAREVDTKIEKLGKRLLNLRTFLEMVDSTCRKSEYHMESVPASMRDSLEQCQETLNKIHEIVEGLASRKSGTFLEKAKLKIRTKASDHEIEEALKDLKHHREHIRDCMAVWAHQRTANIDRRTSNALPAPPQPTENGSRQSMRPPNRTLSDASTVCEPSEGFRARSSSSTTHQSRRSRSSGTSSLIQSPTMSEGSESIFSETSRINPIKEADQPFDLSYLIRSQKSDESQAQIVKHLLEQHPEGSTLANAKDQYGRTPLCIAAQFGEIHIAHMLVANFSADVNAKDYAPKPCSVLDHAVANNKQAFVGFLLDADVDQKNLLEQNRTRFLEMKTAIEFRRKRASQQKGKSKKTKRTSSSVGALT